MKRQLNIIFPCLFFLIIIREVLLYKQIESNYTFNYFIRDYFNKIFIKTGVNTNVDINRIGLLLSSYVVIYYRLFSNISVNIESFKHLIKYNSKNAYLYYYRTLGFFTKILLRSSVVMLAIFLLSYLLIFKSFDYNSYIYGLADLIKLALLIFIVILISVLFPIKRMVTFILLYIALGVYIFLINYAEFTYIIIIYLVSFLVALVKVLFIKNDF